MSLCKWDIQLCEKAHLSVGRGQVIPYTKAILLVDIFYLNPRLFTYFPAHCLERGRLFGDGAIAVAFENAADDVVATGIDIDSLAFIEQDAAVACLNDGTNRKRIAQFFTLAPLCKPGDARCDIFLVTCVPQQQAQGATRLCFSLYQPEQRGIEEWDTFFTCDYQFLFPQGIHPALHGWMDEHAQ